MYCSAAGDISKPWWQVSDEGTHEGRLFDKEVTTLGVTDKEKRGTGLRKKIIRDTFFIVNIYYKEN